MKNKLRIISKVFLGLVIIGFFLPVEGIFNGFQIINFGFIGGNYGMPLALLAGFLSALAGVALAFVYKKAPIGIDWIPLAICIGCGFILKNDFYYLHIGAYVMIAGGALSFITLCFASIVSGRKTTEDGSAARPGPLRAAKYQLVAAIAGIALYVVLYRFVRIGPPLGLWINGYILFRAVTAIVAALFGPVVGVFVGFIGEIIGKVVDFASRGGGLAWLISVPVWISALCAGLYGGLVGVLWDRLKAKAEHNMQKLLPLFGGIQFVAGIIVGIMNGLFNNRINFLFILRFSLMSALFGMLMFFVYVRLVKPGMTDKG